MQVILTEQEYNQLKAMAVAEPQIEARAAVIAGNYRTRLVEELLKWIPLHSLVGYEKDNLKHALNSVPLIAK